jgi:hypothetical protein
MANLVQKGFAKRLGVHVAAIALLLPVALCIAYEAWTPLIVVGVILAVFAACLVVWWDDIDEHFDGSPGLGAALLIASAVIGGPVLLLYERVPFVPKSRWIKCRIAGRRVKQRVRGAVAFHLERTVRNGREATPALFVILRRTSDAARLRPDRQLYVEAYRSQLASFSVPEDAPDELYVGFVSKEEIAAGGGDFHFWRDGPRVS